MKKIRLLVLSLVALTLLFAASCAGRTFLVSPDAVRSVRTIAVIGFDTYVSADISSRVNKLVGPDLLIQTLSSGWRPNVTSPINAKDAYGAFGDRIERELGVRVLTYDEISTNPAYAEIVQKYANSHAVGNLRVDGILSGESARKLTEVERASLKSALGVDAVMAIEVSYWVDDSDTISDIGGERLWARIDAALYTDGEEPIWRDQADGERTKSGLPPLVTQEALGSVRKSVEESTQKALDLLFRHLSDRCPTCKNAQASVPMTSEIVPAESASEASVEVREASAPEDESVASTETVTENATPEVAETPATEATIEASATPVSP